MSDFLGAPFPFERQNYSDSGLHVGGTIGGGVTFTNGPFTASLGGEFETWRVPSVSVTGVEPARLRFVQ